MNMNHDEIHLPEGLAESLSFEWENVPCPKCGQEGGQRCGALVFDCDACAPKQVRQEQPEKLWWEAHVPPDYQRAIMERVNPAVIAAAEAWNRKGFGLGIFGPPGKGKTCAAAVACKIINSPMKWINGQRLRDLAITAASNDDKFVRQDAANRWTLLENTALLVIDDLDKPHFSEAYASRLFGLLEERRSNMKPIIWTGNKGPGALRERILAGCQDIDLAKSIERRLVQNLTLIQQP